MPTFWMVWKEGGAGSTCQHWSEADARKEAERLARTVEGKFYVLEAIASVVKPTVIWRRASDETHGDNCGCDTCIPF